MHQGGNDPCETAIVPRRTPQASEAWAKARFRYARQLWPATVRHFLHSGLLEFVVEAPDQAGGDIVHGLIYERWRTRLPQIERTDQHLEIRPLKKNQGLGVRLVRRGMPADGDPRRYELAECYFRVPPTPVELWYGDDELDWRAERVPPADLHQAARGEPTCCTEPVTLKHLIEVLKLARRVVVVLHGARIELGAVRCGKQLIAIRNRHSAHVA